MSLEVDLEVENVVKRFGDFTAVDRVSFTIPRGSFFSILGPSGCGKTTLLRMIAGFQQPDEGSIKIKGRDMTGVPPNRRPANMVFQDLALFPMMSVGENIAYGLRRRGMLRREIAKRVDAMLDRVGLPGSTARRIEQLSGGQKQRVAIARCLVLEPALLLLDEPLGALDLKLREQMKVELKMLQEAVGTTFVYITHDQSEALVMSDRVAVMNRGRFEQVAAPAELYYQPRTAFVAGFVGESNRLTGRVERTEGPLVRVEVGDRLSVLARSSAATGREVQVFVRPEGIVISRDAEGTVRLPNRLSGKVDSLLFDGANSRALVSCSGLQEPVVVALPQTGEFADLAAGQDVHLGWAAEQVTVFPAGETP
jgi:spermidine/putrescine transport system ATP-binding protein